MSRKGRPSRGREGRRIVAEARAHHVAGRLREAQALYRRALARNPAEAEALHGLGILAHQAGMYEHAIDLIRRAIAVEDGIADFHHNLGEACRACGRLDEAVGHFRRAHSLDPASARTLISLGLVLMGLDDPAGAEVAFRKALNLEPGNADVWNACGNALQLLGRTEEAIAAYRQALAGRPDLVAAWVNLANLLNRSGAPKAAIPCYEKAHALQPEDTNILLGLADALTKAGRIEEAAERFEQVLARRPDEVFAVGGLVSLLERMNRLDKARATVDRLMSLAPDNPASRCVLAVIEAREGEYDRARDRLEGLMAEDLTPGLRAEVAGELGKVLDRLGDYDAAFAAFRARSEAAGRRKPEPGIDPAGYRAMIERSVEWASRDGFPAWADGDAGETEDGAPVFFVGFPRSGTTLMETFLDSHPDLFGTDEAPLVSSVRRRAAEILGAEWQYPEGVDRLSGEQVADLRDRYWATAKELFGAQVDERRLVDKFPLNIVHLGLIHRIFPNARVIVALRDPRDVVLSCFTQNFKQNDAMTNFLTLDSTVDLYSAVMRLWQRYEKALPIRRIVYRYEELVADPAAVVGRVFDFLGLEWDEELLRPERRRPRTAISTPSYRDVTKPVYRSAVGRWRHYRDHLAPVLPALEPFVKAFGYEEG